jgi:hypothetical protein
LIPSRREFLAQMASAGVIAMVPGAMVHTVPAAGDLMPTTGTPDLRPLHGSASHGAYCDHLPFIWV